MDNNILGLQDPVQNDITDVNKQFQSNNIYSATELNAKMQEAREEALESNLAGEPYIPQLLNVPENKPDLDDSTITSSFTTRDQIMSKIGLMDENYNYTDTYTNYISRGGQVPQGYEYAHQEMLDQERYDQIFQKVDNGEMSYDQGLMEAYGQDIMAASFGMDLTSVAYWKNKFLNDDFSNPFANRYLMDQVKQAAEEYHKARQAGQFAHSQAQTALTASSLLGDELDATQVKDLFGDIGKYAEEQAIDDTTLLKQINSNQIPAAMRMVQIDENTWAFLHTDGKLHQLKKGENIKFDENGQPTEISLNGNDALDFADHFGASFAQVFRGLIKLGAFATAVHSIWTDQSYIEALSDDMATVDALANDLDFNVLGRLDHYDLDGFKWEAKDIFMAIGDISGMVAGSAALAGMGNFLTTQGATMASESTSMFGKSVGKFSEMVGKTALRSTGWFNGAGGSTASLFGHEFVGTSAHWINTAFKATPVLALKDFQQTVTAMNTINVNAMLQGQDRVYSEEDMTKRAFGMAAFSWVTSTILSSNVDSSLSERMGVNNYKMMNEVNNVALQKAQEGVTNEAKNEALKALLKSKTNYLKIDNFFDMLNTIAGNEFQSFLTTTKKDENGKISKVSLDEYINGYADGDTEVGNLFKRPEFWKNVVQTGVMQFKEYNKGKAQMLSGYNAAAQSLREANENIVKDFDKRIAKTKNANDIEALKLVKQQYLNDVTDPNNGDVVEKRIVKAMDNLCDHIGEGKNAPEIVRNAIESAVNDKKRSFYSETLAYMESSLQVRKEVYKQFYKDAVSDGKFLSRKFEQFKANLSNKSKGIKGAQQDIAKFEGAQLYAAEKTEKDMYKSFQEDIGMLHTAEARDKENVNINFDDAINVYASSTEFNKDTKLLNALSQKKLDKDNVIIYQMKQEAQSGEGFNPRLKQSIFKTSMDLLAENPATGIVKLDDNNYALSTLTGTYRQAMTFEQLTTLNTAVYDFQNDKHIEGAKHLMGAFFGDKGAQSESEAYDSFNAFLDTAVKNKAFTELDAADAMHILMNTNDKSLNYLRKTLTDAVNNLEPGTTEFNKASKSMQTLVFLEALGTTENYIGKNKVANNSNMMKKLNVLRSVGKDGSITLSKQTQDVIDMLRRTGRWSTAQDERLNQAIKSTGDARVPVDGGIIDDLEDSSSNAPQSEDKNQKGRIVASLTGERKNTKLKKQAFNEIEKTVEQLNKFNATTTEHKSSGKYLVLDLSNEAGEKSYEMIKRQKEIDRQPQGYHMKLEAVNGVSEEFSNRVNTAIQQGSSILRFDLEDPEDIQNFVTIANELKMFGKPLQAETKEDVVGRLKDLKNNWNNSITFSEGTKKYIKLSNQDQEELKTIEPDLHLLDLVDYDDGKEKPYDYAKDFISKVQLNKIPKSAKKSRKGLLSLLPFGNKLENQLEIGEIFGTDIAKAKAGTIAGKTVGATVDQYADVLADTYSMDPDTSTYIYLRNIIEQSDPETFMFSYHYNKGEKQKLIDKLTKAHIINTDDAFYEILSGTRDNTLRIVLKQDQKDNMINYLNDSSDFNLYRILPLYSDQAMQKSSNYVMATNADGSVTFKNYDGEEQTAYIPDMYNGSDTIQQTGIQQILNIGVDYDYNSTTKARVLGELFASNENEDLNYDPFHGNKTINTSARKEVLDAYTNGDTKTLTKLLKEYSDSDYEIKMISKLVELEDSYSADNDDEAYKLFYNDSDIAKRLLKAKENGEDISSNNIPLKEEIKAMYLKAHNNSYNTSDVQAAYGGTSYTNPRYSNDDNLYVTPSVLSKLTSSDYYLDYDENNPESIKLFNTSLDQALDSFNAIVENDTLKNYLSNPTQFTMFKKNNITRCLQGLLGNDGYVPIEDAEHWANLTDAELNKIAEVLGDKAYFNALSNVRSTAQKSFDQYSNFIGEDRKPTLYKQYSNLGVSLSVEGKQNLVTTDKDINPITKAFMEYEDPKEYNDKYIKLYDDTIDELNDKYTGLLNKDDFRAAILRHQDNEIRERAYSPQWAEVLNTENVFALDQQIQIMDKTMNTLEADLNLPKASRDIDVKTKITEDMFYSAMDFTREKSRQLLKAYDLKTGENILTTKAYDEDGNVIDTINSGLSFNGKNNFEVYTSLSNIDLKDGDEIEFMMLNPHPIDTYDEISYKHLRLNKDNLTELKNYYLGKSFETYLNSNKNKYSGYDMDQFKNHLLSLKENHPAQFDELMNDMIVQQVDRMTQKRQVVANLKTMQLFEGKTAEFINKAVTPSLIGSTEYDNSAINNYLKGVKSSLDSDNVREQVQAALITHGIHKSLLTTEDVKELDKETKVLIKDLELSDDQKEDINKISHLRFGSEEYISQMRKLREKYPELTGEQFLNAYVAYGDNPEVLSLKTSGIGIEDLKNRKWNDVSLTVTTDNGKERIQLLDFANDGKTKVDFDLEGIVPINEEGIYNTKTLRDIFQAHLTTEDPEGNVIDKTYFILHGDMTPKEFAEQMHLNKNSYYKDNEGYRDAVDLYIKGTSSDANILWVTEKEFGDILKSYNNTTFLAFNGENYDFNYIRPFISGKNNMTLDAAEFDNILYGGDSISRRKLEVLTKEMSTFQGKTHNAETDTHNQREWRMERTSSYSDSFKEAKQKMVAVADSILSEFDVDEDKRNSIIKNLDTKVKTYYDSNGFKYRFTEGLPNGAESAYIQRQLNHLRMDNMGYILHTLSTNPEFLNYTGLEKFEGTLAPQYRNNIIDHVVGLSLEKNVSPKDALQILFKADDETGQLYNDRWIELATTPANYEHTDEFNSLKKEIMTKHNILIPSEDYKDVKKFEPTQKYMYTNSEFMEGFSNIDPDLQETLRDGVTTFLSSTESGLDQFGKPFKVIINNKGANKLDQVTNEIKSVKGEVATSREGTYKKIFGMAPTEAANMQALKWNSSKRKFEKTNDNVTLDASSIIMDRRRIYDLLGQDISNYMDNEGNLYVMTLRQPSANKLQTEYFKVIPVEGDKGMAWVTPTIWRTKFAGDYDGDNITNFSIMNPFEKRIAAFESNNMYLGDILQEELFSHLNTKLKDPTIPSHLVAAMQLSKNEGVINVAKEIDAKLPDASISDEEFNARLKEVVKPLAEDYLNRNKEYAKLLSEDKESFVDDIVKDIGVKTSNGHRHIDVSDIINDENSTSAKARHDIILDSASIKTNLADSIFGFHKQRFMTNDLAVDNMQDMPLTKMDIAPTYIADELLSYIGDLNWTKKDIGDYYDVIQNVMTKYIKTHDISEETISNLYKAELSKNTFIDLIEGQPDKAQAIRTLTRNLFNNIDEALRYDSNLNKEYSKILKDSENYPTSYFTERERRKNIINTLNSIRGSDTYIRGVSSKTSQEDNIVAEALSDGYGKNANTQFVTKINELMPDNKATVLIFEGTPLNGVEDGMWVNDTSKIRSIVGIQQVDLDRYKYDGELPSSIKKFITEGTMDLDLIKKNLADDEMILNKMKNDQKLSKSQAKNAKGIHGRISFYKKVLSLNDGVDVKLLNSNDNSFSYIVTESLAGSKGYAIGKGMIDNLSVVDGYKDFDVAINAEQLSRFDKLGQFPMFNILDSDEVEVKVKTSNGVVTKKARVLKDVPFNLLASNDKVTKNHPQKLDLMTLAAMGNSFTAHGALGKAVLNVEGDNIQYSNKFLSDPILEANSQGNICWRNGTDVVQLTRAIALGKIIDEENLWIEYNTSIKENFGVDININSFEEFQNAIKAENPTSKKFQSAISNLISFLNNEGYSLESLKNNHMSETERRFFGSDIEDYLNPMSQGSIKDYNTNLTTKHKAKESLYDKSSYFFGAVYNPGEHTASRNINVMSDEYYYIPMNEVYKTIAGYYPSNKDILKGTADELFSYAKHYAGEQGDRFVPKDVRYATQAPSDMGADVAFNSLKNGQVNTEADVNWIANRKGGYFKNSGDTPIKKENRSKGAYNRAIAEKALTDYTIPRGQRAGAMLEDLLFAPDEVTGYIRASNKNISEDIVMNMITDKWSAQDGQPLLTMQSNTKTGSYKYLTGKGNDFITSNMNFYTMKDINSKIKTPTDIDISSAEIPQETTTQDKRAIAKAYGIIADAFDMNSKATNKFTEYLDLDRLSDTQLRTEFAYGADNVDVFKSTPLDYLMTSQGIHIGKDDRGDTIGVSMALENAYGEAQMIEANANELLFNLQKATKNRSPQEFQDFVTYVALSEAESKGENISLYLTAFDIDRNYYETTMKQNYETLNNIPQINKAFNDFVDYRMEMQNTLSRMYNEPFGNLMTFLTPYTSTKNKEMAYGKIRDNLHAALNFNEYNIIDSKGQIKSNMMFNFWEANKTMNRETAKLLGEHQVTEVLHSRGLLDNVDTTNKIQEYLSDGNIDINNLYVKKEYLDSEEYNFVHNTIIDIIRRNTDVDIYGITRIHKNSIDQLKALWSTLDEETSSMLENLPEGYEKDYVGLKCAIVNNPYDEHTPELQKIYNYMTARLLVAQRLAELNPNVMTNIENYFNSIYSSGKVLVNKYGQKLNIDSYVTPIGDSSARWLAENIEIAANNQNKNKWNQFLMEKALRGELYVMNQDLADQLEQKHFTTKTPSKIISKLSHISKLSAGIQMMMPAKMLGRLFRFTGTDIMLGGTYSPYVYSNLGRAGKELSAALYSKGATVTEGSDLYDYIMREGQPLNASGKDPITYSEDLNSKANKVIDFFTSPLAVQNHVGRYAIWLTAKESFDNGDPWYGPTYYLHKQVDNLADNRDKATFIMDNMIGSPGGFPYLSKKTNGLMMFTTFPMNLTRTAGAYAMSVGTLFQEGLTSENAPQWMKTIAAPSCTTLVAAYLGNLLISYVCDKYGVDEETEKKWQEEGVTIDPLGTMLGGTPSVVYDSLNPYYQLKEMYVNPWTNEYNKTFGDKAFGFLTQTVFSKLNPAIKIPTELLIQKDLMGSSSFDTSANYTRLENGIRKVLGFFVGSGVANSVVDQYKIDSHSEDSNFASSMWKGITKGFSSDLGNQKSWKKDISNYYNVIDSLKNYSYSANEGYYGDDATYENLMQGKYMADHRNYNKGYGDVNEDDYKRVNNQLKKMINSRTDPTTVYAYIADEWNKGVSEATLRKALNNNSLARRLNTLYGGATKAGYLRTLSDKDLIALEKALKWEEETYPLLKDFFPDASYTKKFYYKKPYYKSTGSGTSYPKSYKPSTPKYYPSSGYSNKKYKSKGPSASIERVEVKVSPEMAVWNQDYNKTKDLVNWKDTDYKRVKPLNHGGGK